MMVVKRGKVCVVVGRGEVCGGGGKGEVCVVVGRGEECNITVALALLTKSCKEKYFLRVQVEKEQRYGMVHICVLARQCTSSVARHSHDKTVDLYTTCNSPMDYMTRQWTCLLHVTLLWTTCCTHCSCAAPWLWDQRGRHTFPPLTSAVTLMPPSEDQLQTQQSDTPLLQVWQGIKLLWTEYMAGTSWSDTGWRWCAYRLTRWNLMIMVRWLLTKAFCWCMNPTLKPSSYCRSPVFKFRKTVAAGRLSASLPGRQKQITHTSEKFSFPSD